MARFSLRRIVESYRNWWHPNPPKPPYDHICQIGDPILRYNATKVIPSDIGRPEIQFVIQMLKTVMRRYDAVGLAAPQIGIPFQIFAIEFPESKQKEFSTEVYTNRQMQPVPFRVFINPVLQIVNYDKVQFPESCESVRGFMAEVPRYKEVRVTGLNQAGESETWQVGGWPARIIQHEMDHLRGRMYTDIMLRESLSCSCWEKVNQLSGRIQIPFVPR